MPFFEIKSDSIEKVEETTFSDVGLKERADLQRLLRRQIDVVAPDLLVIAEEFGDWQESRRQIDLLAIDKDANLVVIELKRTEDGGHMELQAIRYAAMISTMTFEQAVDAYQEFLEKIGSDAHALETLLEFLEWEEPDEDSFAQDIRIILVSAEFSKELTSSVLWLNDRGLDIRCVRIKPYKHEERVIIDVQQIIPLPEAEEYMVGIREKAGKEREDRAGKGLRHQLRMEFWQGLLEKVRNNEQAKLFSGISPSKENWISAGAGMSNISYNYLIRRHDAEIQLVMWDTKERNKAYFDQLYEHKAEIEKAFGGELEWHRRDESKQSYIRKKIPGGGTHDEKATWPKIQDAMIDAMIRFEKALSPHLRSLRRG